MQFNLVGMRLCYNWNKPLEIGGNGIEKDIPAYLYYGVKVVGKQKLEVHMRNDVHFCFTKLRLLMLCTVRAIGWHFY